jgi:hypothetical protein
MSQHKVTILYQDSPEKEPAEHLIEPYHIEATAGPGSYIIAYDNRKKTIGHFYTNNIEQLRMEPDTFEIPPDFNADDYVIA